MQVRAIELCYDGTSLREAGAVFEYDGPPHASLVLVEVPKVEPEPAPAPADTGKRQKKAAPPGE